MFPRQATVTDKFSIVRSLHHDTGDHFAGGHRMLTAKDMGVSGANNAGKFPSIGAIVHREVGARRYGMPGYVAVPQASSIGLSPGYFGGNFLGATHDPFATGGDPNAAAFTVHNLELTPGLSIDRLEDRRGLSRRFDAMTRTVETAGVQQSMDRFGMEAVEFVSKPQARRAFSRSVWKTPSWRPLRPARAWARSTP